MAANSSDSGVTTYPKEEYSLPNVGIETICEGLKGSLAKYFKSAEVSVTDCPDLTKAPYFLASEGIGGYGVIVDLGGVPYLIPTVDRTKVYDLATVIPEYVGKEGFPNGWNVTGAGAGPWPTQGSNCELVVDLCLKPSEAQGVTKNNSKVGLTSNGNETDLKVKNIGSENETKCALLANLLVSSGKGKVLDIKCKGRLGSDAKQGFTTILRNCLNEKFGPSTPIGLGGLFTVNYAKTKVHVMRDFSATPLNSDEDVDNWLKFFSLDPPFLCQSVVVSTDPGLDLRVEHSHGWTLDEGTSGLGHYHYDLLPTEVEYHGLYAVADKIVRIDRPSVTHSIGRD